jgi:hypothetical protein
MDRGDEYDDHDDFQTQLVKLCHGIRRGGFDRIGNSQRTSGLPSDGNEHNTVSFGLQRRDALLDGFQAVRVAFLDGSQFADGDFTPIDFAGNTAAGERCEICHRLQLYAPLICAVKRALGCAHSIIRFHRNQSLDQRDHLSEGILKAIATSPRPR